MLSCKNKKAVLPDESNEIILRCRMDCSAGNCSAGRMCREKCGEILLFFEIHQQLTEIDADADHSREIDFINVIGRAMVIAVKAGGK